MWSMMLVGDVAMMMSPRADVSWYRSGPCRRVKKVPDAWRCVKKVLATWRRVKKFVGAWSA